MSRGDWKDAKTHREPKWPFGGYAPGDYAGLCHSCGETVVNIDKRATQCLPCAMDAAQELIASYKAKTAELEASVRDLDATIQTLFGPGRTALQEGGRE